MSKSLRYRKELAHQLKAIQYRNSKGVIFFYDVENIVRLTKTIEIIEKLVNISTNACLVN